MYEYNTNTIIHEKAHAKCILQIINNNNKYKRIPSIIMLGDYDKGHNPYKVIFDNDCMSYIIFFPCNEKSSKRGLTLHPCMDLLTNDEIKTCVIAGYKEEIFNGVNKPLSCIEALYSSDLICYICPNSFRHKDNPSYYSDYFYSIYPLCNLKVHLNI